MALSPLVFFNWTTKRHIVDIRPAAAFVKGSFPGAVSVPADQFKTRSDLLTHLRKTYLQGTIHIINSDGSEWMTEETESDIDFLEGGYDAFKSWRDNIYTQAPALAVVSGKTGSGKTEFLKTLENKGRQILDLEALANHRGSVFGALDAVQPSVEQFQYNLLKTWLSFDPSLPVWIEDKGLVLGKLRIPEKLYQKIARTNYFELNVPFEIRLRHIKEEYAIMDKKVFTECIKKLVNRMGVSANHKALHFHNTGQVDKCLILLLGYYDRAYEYMKQSSSAKKYLTIEFSACRDDAYIQQLEAMIAPTV